LFITIIIDYFAGLGIEKSVDNRKKTYLILSLISNIGILVLFKYYNFFISNINSYLPNGSDFSLLSIVLPVGLSFHTFQAMSYTIEVYRGNQKAEKHFGIYALYVMFYPQLVAGPIERPQNILHQFKEENKFDFDRISSGLKLILYGLVKKVVVADRLAIVVDEVYANPQTYNGVAFLIGAVFFSFQIYCDFSGYSDIAIGSARVLGFDLMKNFKQPYFSKSMSEFWSRWHISLSTWFKDYLYIPLGGNRVSKVKVAFNLFIVFMVSGLWHGANWTFVVWGLIHGALVILSNMLTLNIKLPSLFAYVGTFIIVTVAWIFFRSESLDVAFHFINRMFSFTDNSYFQLSKCDIHGLPPTFIALPLWKFLLSALLIPILLLADYLQSKGKFSILKLYSPVFSYVFYSLIIISIMVFGVFETKQFIYFQF
jgi:D-alanyl-lipoteichoic acid acyltransferase DltB (MBOAT superfamily)